MIYSVFLPKGEPGKAETLTVAELWNRYAHWPEEFADIMLELLSLGWYDSLDSDGVLAYTTRDHTTLQAEFTAWYHSVNHTPDLERVSAQILEKFATA